MLVHIEKTNNFFSERKLKEVMCAYIILHNMIIEDERRAICTYDEHETIPETQPIKIGGNEYIDRKTEIHSTETFHNLHMDFVEHIYEI